MVLARVFAELENASIHFRRHQRGRSKLVIDSLVFEDAWNLRAVVMVMVLVKLLLKLLHMFFREDLACTITTHLFKALRTTFGLRIVP